MIEKWFSCIDTFFSFKDTWIFFFLPLWQNFFTPFYAEGVIFVLQRLYTQHFSGLFRWIWLIFLSNNISSISSTTKIRHKNWVQFYISVLWCAVLNSTIRLSFVSLRVLRKLRYTVVAVLRKVQSHMRKLHRNVQSTFCLLQKEQKSVYLSQGKEIKINSNKRWLMKLETLLE